MQEKWLNDLKSTNPQERSRAIIAMAESFDAEALKILKYVFENDADPNVRQLAKKAGAHLWQTLNAQQQTAPEDESLQVEAPPAKPAQDQPAQQTHTAQPEQTIPSHIRKPSDSAQIQLTRALTLLVKEDKIGAIRALQNALVLDPQVLKDPVALNLASELTGLPPNDAIKVLQKKSTPASDSQQSNTQSALPISRTGLYIFIGVVVFIVIVLIIISRIA